MATGKKKVPSKLRMTLSGPKINQAAAKRGMFKPTIVKPGRNFKKMEQDYRNSANTPRGKPVGY